MYYLGPEGVHKWKPGEPVYYPIDGALYKIETEGMKVEADWDSDAYILRCGFNLNGSFPYDIALSLLFESAEHYRNHVNSKIQQELLNIQCAAQRADTLRAELQRLRIVEGYK